MGLVNGRRRFSTPHSSDSPRPIFMKLEIYNYFPDTTPHAKFHGAISTWVVWTNSQFDAWKFLSFFGLFATATGHTFGRTSTFNTSLYVVLAKEVPFGGLEWWNLTPFPQKRKNGTLSWQSIENCSRPNSGTGSCIQFKPLKGIDHPSGIMWHDSKVKRSKVKFTRSRNVFK